MNWKGSFVLTKKTDNVTMRSKRGDTGKVLTFNVLKRYEDGRDNRNKVTTVLCQVIGGVEYVPCIPVLIWRESRHGRSVD